MNTHDKYELPPLFLPGAIGKYTKKEMQVYAREAIEHFLNQSGQYLTNDASRQAAIDAAIEADRQRRELPDTSFAHWLDIHGYDTTIGADGDYADTDVAMLHEAYRFGCQRRGEPGGWELIPVEPTPQMMDAGLYQSSADTDWADLRQAWADMLAAAPQPAEPVNYVMSEDEVYEALYDVAVSHIDSNGISVIEPEILGPLIRVLAVAVTDEAGFSPQPAEPIPSNSTELGETAESVNEEELLAARDALVDMGYLWDGDQWVEVDPPSKTADQAPEWPDFARMEASLQRLKERLVFENGRRKDLEQKLRENRNG